MLQCDRLFLLTSFSTGIKKVSRDAWEWKHLGKQIGFCLKCLMPEILCWEQPAWGGDRTGGTQQDLQKGFLTSVDTLLNKNKEPETVSF